MSFAEAAATDPYSVDTGGFEVSQPAAGGEERPRTRPRSRSRSARSRSRSPNYRRGSRSPPPRRSSTNPNRQAPPTSTVLGVFGLSIRTIERDLEDEFSRFGRVEKVTIVYDQRSDRSRGFGFIKMATLEDAARCIQELNGLDLHGRRIRVDYSLTERAHPSTPGQYMGHRRREPYERDREYRSSRYDRDRYDRDRYDRDRYDRDRHDRGHDRDRRDRDRDRDRDAFGRDHRRRSPERRSRRSYSRSPPRGGYSSPPRKDYDQEVNVPAGPTNTNGDAANW